LPKLPKIAGICWQPKSLQTAGFQIPAMFANPGSFGNFDHGDDADSRAIPGDAHKLVYP